MKSNYLLPHKIKILGWILFAIGISIGVYLLSTDYESELFKTKVIAIYNQDNVFNNNDGFFKIIENSIMNEIGAIFIIFGGLLIGFSKEKIEDEFIYKLRKDSLAWAMIVNYIILMFTIIFIYEFTFFHVLVFNMFLPLIFFIFRFHFLKMKHHATDE